MIMSFVAWKNNIAYCLLGIKFVYVMSIDGHAWIKETKVYIYVCVACWFVTWKLLIDDDKETLHVNVWALAEWFSSIGRDEVN